MGTCPAGSVRIKAEPRGLLPKRMTHTGAIPATAQTAIGSVRGLFQDPAFRYALKFGLAGVVAVYIALWARLEMPGWALFTVFVLMIAHYVGAIAEKSIFRFIGTVTGGLIGYLLTGGLEQNPVVFLSLVGLTVGGCTAMFGQNRYPYAFLLCGLTILVVSSNGMADPANSWKFMLARIEEIVVGIIVTMVVQSVIWPRYARLEFLDHLRASFGDLRECLLNAPGITGASARKPGALEASDFPCRITELRTLLEFGARESLFFRRRLQTYFELTVCLSKTASAIATLRESLPPDSPYRTHAGGELDALHKVLAESLEDLSGTTSSKDSRREMHMAINAAFAKLDERFLGIRSQHLAASIPTDQALIMGLHVSGLDDIRRQMETAHALLDGMPEDPLQREVATPPLVSSWPSPFWIRAGIKSGLAVVITLLVANWLNPPGSSMFILGTWVFTAMNASSPAGQGDRKAFHLIPLNVISLLGLSLVLLAIRPLLSSYAVMNTILFVWLFVWGYLSYKTRGMTIPMQLAMLMLVGILSLNGQQPIGFQAISGFFFGLVMALVLSALFQRLLWPSLPQWEVRDRIIEAAGICRRMLAREEIPLWMRTRLALIPGEVESRLGRLDEPICPAGEPENLRGLMRTLADLGGILSITLDRVPEGIPAEPFEEGKKLVQNLENFFNKHLEAIQTAFKTSGPLGIENDELVVALTAWRAWAAAVRSPLLDTDFHPLALARITGFVERYHLLGQDILALGRQFEKLRLPLYMGDYSL